MGTAAAGSPAATAGPAVPGDLVDPPAEVPEAAGECESAMVAAAAPSSSAAAPDSMGHSRTTGRRRSRCGHALRGWRHRHGVALVASAAAVADSVHGRQRGISRARRMRGGRRCFVDAAVSSGLSVQSQCDSGLLLKR